MRVVNAGSHHAEDMADKEKDTMEPFDWKQKFDVSYTYIDSTDGFDRYHIENETGDGTIAACTVFPGLQAVLLDFRLRRCDNLLTLNKDVIDMGYCIDGRFECNVNRQYCYLASAGDFSLSAEGRVLDVPGYTFSGVAVYRPDAFRDVPEGHAPLKPFFQKLIREGRITGEVSDAFWCDVGTPERLHDLDRRLVALSGSREETV